MAKKIFPLWLSKLFFLSGIYLMAISLGLLFNIDPIMRTLPTASQNLLPPALNWAYLIVDFVRKYPFWGLILGFLVSWFYLGEIDPSSYKKIKKWAL